MLGHTPASRPMSVDGGDSSRARDRKRAREGSESTPSVSLLGTKKPKMKKGQERLAPTGRFRNLYLHCEKLMEGLMKEKMAVAYFNIPVDPIALGIPQYPDIVKNPMDLGTVKTKLAEGFYSGVECLEADVYLTFDNVSSVSEFSRRICHLCPGSNAAYFTTCLTYSMRCVQAMFFNPPGTDVHECARALKDIAEKRIKRLPKAPSAQSMSSLDSPGIGTPNSVGTAADMMRKMEQMQRDLEALKNKGSSSAKKPADGSSKKKAANNANRIMTFEEKRTLSLNINKLPHDKLGKVVEIIKKRRSNVVGNSEEIEIDIDLLDNTTLRELDKYVRDCLNPSKPEASDPSKAAALAAT